MPGHDAFFPHLQKEWYIQGFNAAPVFLNHAAYSGMVMRKKLGFGYSAFIFDYKERYGEMWYLPSDFILVWGKVKERIGRDPDYLEHVKQTYERDFSAHLDTLRNASPERLGNIGDNELCALLKNIARAQTDSVGVAHILDALGIRLEQEFKEAVMKKTDGPKTGNEIYAALSLASKPSFIAQEESDLRMILGMRDDPERDRALIMHANRYSWIQNSYAGPKRLTTEYFRERLSRIDRMRSEKLGDPTERGRLVSEYDLGEKILGMSEMIDFSIVWQDERKANVLKVIEVFGDVLEEVGKRTGVSTKTLCFLGVSDIEHMRSIADIPSLGNILEERSRGCYFLIESGKDEKIAVGESYDILKREQERLFRSEDDGPRTDFHGSTANKGTAIGPVAVCKDEKSIGKVKEGDILVTSMTRPEFMPALKKAAAIITDEGGITSHAAIVARELGIPAVIGTKVATRYLKDGMMVEVRANHGMVRILD